MKPQTTIRDAYQASLKAGTIVADEAQRRAVEKLDELQQRLHKQQRAAARPWRWLPGHNGNPAPRGIYLWGGVGRGKTFLMDLFYGTLDFPARRRIHFHRMLSDVHARLKRLQNNKDPLDKVAAEIAAEATVLCFDELFVSDIGNAMILGRLFDGLMRYGVTLVATSNSQPRDLYKGGLQRQRFLPAIEVLEACTEIIELGGNADYRLRLFDKTGTYLLTDDESTAARLLHYFKEIAGGGTAVNQPLNILGREIRTKRFARGIAWFDFFDICDGPRSQEDYIELARWYPTIILSGVPPLTAALDDPARRLIALVDEFYDRRVKLVIAAATPVKALYQGQRLRFEFRRCASRLEEMQSTQYLHAAHLA